MRAVLLVDRPQLGSAVFDGSVSRTAETVRYAAQRDVPALRLDPVQITRLGPAEMARFAEEVVLP